MLKGKTTFKCTQCGKTFKALDIEYHATALSQPMPCPNCKSIRTMPLKDMWLDLFGTKKRQYHSIWVQIEEGE